MAVVLLVRGEEADEGRAPAGDEGEVIAVEPPPVGGQRDGPGSETSRAVDHPESVAVEEQQDVLGRDARRGSRRPGRGSRRSSSRGPRRRERFPRRAGAGPRRPRRPRGRARPRRRPRWTAPASCRRRTRGTGRTGNSGRTPAPAPSSRAAWPGARRARAPRRRRRPSGRRANRSGCTSRLGPSAAGPAHSPDARTRGRPAASSPGRSRHLPRGGLGSAPTSAAGRAGTRSVRPSGLHVGGITVVIW